MKLSISSPATGYQKPNEVDNELKLSNFCEKPMVTAISAEVLVKGGRLMWSQSVMGKSKVS